MKEYTQTELFFDSISGKKVCVDFEGGAMSSDGGALLLRQIEKRVGVIDALVESIRDVRHQSYVEHELGDLIRQRVLQIACGYPEAVASNALRDDPAFKAGCDRLPFSGATLAGQSTMSRLENSVSRTDIYRMSRAMVDVFLDSFAKRPKKIVLDFDETCDPTHGAQQGSLFHAFYDTYCFLPLHVYESGTGRLVTTILRAGKTPTGRESAAIVKRLIRYIRKRWPKVKIVIRGDSHYGRPEVCEVCEAENVCYILGLATNSRLQDMVLRSWWELTRDTIGEYRTFTELTYQARSWRTARRVIVRVDAKERGVDIRFVVTNMPQKNAGYLYDKVYCRRCQMENLIKDHKNGLRSDLTSCTNFTANCFRLLLHSAAYILLHHLRERILAGTSMATALFDTLRLKLLRIGARIIEKSKVVRFHLPTTYAYQEAFVLAHARLFHSGSG
jgi:hypothetical protein